MGRASFTGVRAVAVGVLLLSVAAVIVVALFQAKAESSRRAQDDLTRLAGQVNELNTAPLSMALGSSQALVLGQMRRLEKEITQRVRTLAARDEMPALKGLNRVLAPAFKSQNQIALLVRNGPSGGEVSAESREASTRILVTARRNFTSVNQGIDEASARYGARARNARRQATVGSAATIGLLALAFLFAYRRSRRERAEAQRLAAENAALAGESRQEALTDALTGLGNRRALVLGLEQALVTADDRPAMLALFDLDGFKQYNDTFGHQAGDALLCRLGEQLVERLPDGVEAFRMGGDEFCILARSADAVAVAQAGADALSDHGDGFSVGSSYGIALAPADATDAAGLLRIADQRMYAQKAARSRSSASQQTVDVLEQVLVEQSQWLTDHGTQVADLSTAIAERLGLPDHEVRRVQLAARLHDIGKTAISADILDRAGPLGDDEWAFVRTHTIIGERIVNAAPALSHVGPLVRSSHERMDGNGYPDGLRGGDIPMGARIVSVCDAFDAMVNDRPYRAAMSAADALLELQRCAGTQFDAQVVSELMGLTAADAPAAGSAQRSRS